MEIAVIRMLSDNVKYEILKLRAVMDPISDTKKMIPSGTYAGRELLTIVEGMVELNQFVVDDQVIKKNKLKSITEMIINLDELNNSDNLEDGHPSNTLFTYHMTDDKDFTHFEPCTPQYRKLKNGEFTFRLVARYQIWATTPPHSRTKQHHLFYVLCDSCNEKKTVVPFKCMAKV